MCVTFIQVEWGICLCDRELWTTIANPKGGSMTMRPSVVFCPRELFPNSYGTYGSNEYRYPRCARKQIREQWVPLGALLSKPVCSALGTSSEPPITWWRCSPTPHPSCGTVCTSEETTLSLKEGDNFLICSPKSCFCLSLPHSSQPTGL